MAKIIPMEKTQDGRHDCQLMNIFHKILLNRKANVLKICLCPRLPKAAVGNIAFRRDATSVRTCVCYVRHQNLINVQADIRYIEIYVLLDGKTLVLLRKLKFGILITQAYTVNSVLELPLGHALGWGWGGGMYHRSDWAFGK